jgi:protein O-GlcNAc transferase
LNIDNALQSAFKYYQAGKLKEAEEIYKKILKKQPKNVGALHFLGIIYFQFGNYDLAIYYIKTELQFAPKDADAHNNLGLSFQGKGQFEEAINCYRIALRLNPNLSYAYYNLGNIFKETNRFDEAIDYYQKSIHLNPAFAEAYNNMGFVLQEKGQWDKAVGFFKKALTLKPNNANIYNNLGLILWKKGQLDEALNYCKKAIRLNPYLADAYNNLGNICKDKGQLDEAISCYGKAIQISADRAYTNNNLELVFQDKGQLDKAISYYQEALKANPTFADAYYNLGNALNEHNKPDEAIAAFDKAILCKPNHFMAHWARCMARLKDIYQDRDDIQNSRKRYVDELIRLRDTIFSGTPQDIEAAAEAVGSSQPFYLAYQGLNDREIQQIYGDMVCRIMASRYPEWSDVTPTMPLLAPKEPVRIGIVSGYFYHHSVWKIPIRGWIMNIDKQRFSLYGYYTGKKKDEATRVARQYFDYFVEDIYSFEELCRRIREDNLHVLIYPEIGMDPTTVRLAALKLAPVQCVSWGHPDTSGLPTMDYYLSSDLIEPTDADDHYTEKLIRLPNMSVYYSPLDMPHADVNRETFGLRQTAILYHCCQSLYKYLPQYDEVFPRIACHVGDCQFLFSSDKKSSRVTEKFRLRIKHAFNRFGLDANDYAVFLPFLDVGRYNAIYNLADVFLDPIGWSGCNTAFEAVAHNLPVVTFPSMLMRGRETSAILTMMGITETIAKSLDEYIEFAGKLGKDPAWRKQLSEKIAANRGLIYQDKKCITALEHFLERVVKERYG